MASETGCSFESGHGGHLIVRLGTRMSVLPMHGKQKELGTGLVNQIKKDLGLMGRPAPTCAAKAHCLGGHQSWPQEGSHPLQSLLCRTTDTACGAVTRGWKLRADAHFELHRALRRNEGSLMFDERPASGVKLTSSECAEKASSGEPAERYRTWLACIESQRPRRVALPLGEFKAPTARWIVISGRRGHYEFCDTTTAYNLATGAAFISDSRSALALRRNGDVDFNATNRARMERVKTGTVSVQNLREAVWMMLRRPPGFE